MAVWLAGLMTFAVVIVGSITVDSEDSMQRERRDDDDDYSLSRVLLCPCFQGCCDDQWYQYKDACYLPVYEQKSWELAKQNCEDLSAHLASVHSEDEDSFIFHLMQKRGDYWLGAEKTHDTATPWKWIDQSIWDYSKLSNQAEQLLFNCLAVKKTDGGTTYWGKVPKLGLPRAYVCKYLLD